jgi:outer membrane protein assembly factor BamE (lipoprotein component of BamABCDE complex)
MSRAVTISVLALVLAVAAVVLAITRYDNPTAADLERFNFPPPLNSVDIGQSEAEVRRIMGRPGAMRRFSDPPEVCWDYVFPTATPHYRLCFENGRLVTRTPF